MKENMKVFAKDLAKKGCTNFCCAVATIAGMAFAGGIFAMIDKRKKEKDAATNENIEAASNEEI